MTFPIIISSNSSNEFLTDGNSPQLQPNVKVEIKNMKVKKYFIQLVFPLIYNIYLNKKSTSDEVDFFISCKNSWLKTQQKKLLLFLRRLRLRLQPILF